MTIRHFWARSAVVGLCLVAGGAMAIDAAAQGSPRLVQPSSLVKIGTFRLPGGQPNRGFEFGGTGLAHNPANNSLYIVGHDWDQLMAEVTIPSLGGTASVLQALRDPSEGLGVGSGDTKIGGALVYQGKLWFTKYLYYDGNGTQSTSHFSRPLALATTGQVTGPLPVGSMNAGFVSGYLGRIPAQWQAALGGTVLTGNCCLSVISRTSFGPAASAWTPGQTSAAPLVYYTVDHQTLGTYGASGSHPEFNGTTRVKGVVFPEGTDSVLFFGRTGTGPYCYGEAAACGDPTNIYKGEHAYPYRMYVWAYDAKDLAAVKAGSKQPWQVVPYAVWDLGIEGTNEFSGSAAYDAATGRVFVAQVTGAGELPLIHVFTVGTAVPADTLAVTPAVLPFSGTNTNGTLGPITGPQTVTVTTSGPSATSWTASANQSWVQITNGSGTGSGAFTVGIVNPGNVLGTTTSASATITVSAANVANSPQTVSVALTLQQASANQPPFGAFDTPASGTTDLHGSFAVTGWALDDKGIDRVEIWRDPVPGETTPLYYGPGQPGHGKIFIARPLFVSGSRPDVEAAYASTPFAYRAGWGYLLLSWGLWQQGNATFTLYAFAYDQDGHSTTLGTKTIAVSNATATRPFGAIDTPAYGATVSGALWNYGWALAPNASPPCTISNGNVWMSIDSGTMVPVNYGDLRTDIASSFPGFSNGNNSGGAYYLDTTTLSNGIHQIGWLVTDGCGRADGIGSRFFTVLNGTGDETARRVSGADRIGPAVVQPASGDVPPIRVRRTGGDWQWQEPTEEGTHVIAIDQSTRIEVQLPNEAGGIFEGYQVVQGDLRALPLGSSLDAQAGIFYWQPAPGFLGSYDLVFLPTTVGSGPPLRVRVVVGPSMRVMIDTPQQAAPVEQPFTVAGWALDLAATDGSGVDTVHVWAYPVDEPTLREPQGRPEPRRAATFLGVAAYGDARPDVGAVYGRPFERSAFGLMVSTLPPGTYDLVVYPHRAVSNRFEGAQVVRVTVR